MHIIESLTNPTLISYAIKIYELELVPLQPIEYYWLPHNPILKLTQHPTVESQLHYSGS